jgi:hypothetical protein
VMPGKGDASSERWGETKISVPSERQSRSSIGSRAFTFRLSMQFQVKRACEQDYPRWAKLNQTRTGWTPDDMFAV